MGDIHNKARHQTVETGKGEASGHRVFLCYEPGRSKRFEHRLAERVHDEIPLLLPSVHFTFTCLSLVVCCSPRKRPNIQHLTLFCALYFFLSGHGTTIV